MINDFQFNMLLTFMFIVAWMRMDERVQLFFAVLPQILYSVVLGLFFLTVTHPIAIDVCVRLFGTRSIIWYLRLDTHVRNVFSEFYQTDDD